MSLDRFIQMLMPKDHTFFQLFEETADFIIEGSNSLKALMLAEPAGRASIFEKIEQLEHKCDDTTHKVYRHLNGTFVTPFDREDIHLLASELDDIMDLMDESAKRIILYRMDKIPQAMIQLVDILEKSILEVKFVISSLRQIHKSEDIRKALVRIHDHENEADKVFEETIAKLFDEEKNAVNVIKMKDIYGSLERATDKCEDVANVVEALLIKHA